MGCGASSVHECVAGLSATNTIDLALCGGLTDGDAAHLAVEISGSFPTALTTPPWARPQAPLSSTGFKAILNAAAPSLRTVEINEAALPKLSPRVLGDALLLLPHVASVALRGDNLPRITLAHMGATKPKPSVTTVVLGGLGVCEDTLMSLYTAFPQVAQLSLENLSADVEWVRVFDRLVALGVSYLRLTLVEVDSSVPNSALPALLALCASGCTVARRSCCTPRHARGPTACPQQGSSHPGSSRAGLTLSSSFGGFSMPFESPRGDTDPRGLRPGPRWSVCAATPTDPSGSFDDRPPGSRRPLTRKRHEQRSGQSQHEGSSAQRSSESKPSPSSRRAVQSASGVPNVVSTSSFGLETSVRAVSFEDPPADVLRPAPLHNPHAPCPQKDSHTRPRPHSLQPSPPTGLPDGASPDTPVDPCGPSPPLPNDIEALRLRAGLLPAVRSFLPPHPPPPQGSHHERPHATHTDSVVTPQYATNALSLSEPRVSSDWVSTHRPSVSMSRGTHPHPLATSGGRSGPGISSRCHHDASCEQWDHSPRHHGEADDVIARSHLPAPERWLPLRRHSSGAHAAHHRCGLELSVHSDHAANDATNPITDRLALKSQAPPTSPPMVRPVFQFVERSSPRGVPCMSFSASRVATPAFEPEVLQRLPSAVLEKTRTGTETPRRLSSPSAGRETAPPPAAVDARSCPWSGAPLESAGPGLPFPDIGADRRAAVSTSGDVPDRVTAWVEEQSLLLSVQAASCRR